MTSNANGSGDDSIPLGSYSPGKDPGDAPELPSVNFGPHFEMHPVVFPAAAAIVLVFVATTLGLISADVAVEELFIGARDWIGQTFGWLYIASMTGLLGLAVWLALSRFGRIKLGKDDEQPEFGRLTWFAMLFSAGMGVGLMFWGVAEPAYHMQSVQDASLPVHDTPFGDVGRSLGVTIFHWGLHPWALYAIVGLALAYFGFRKGMPLSFRSLLHPLLGDLVWGRIGDAIDILAIVATLCGVAASLGMGATQVNAGLAFLFGVPVNEGVQVALITGITAIATVSVVLGLGTGIRRLSEANMILAGILLVVVIVSGGVIGFALTAAQATGGYLYTLPFLSGRLYEPALTEPDASKWVIDWTVLYWAWWIAWSPFVGMFIARVSRGRTIREFILCVMIIPTAVTVAWFSAFGGNTLDQQREYEAAQDVLMNSAHAADAPDLTPQEARDIIAQLPTLDVKVPSDLGPFVLSEDDTLVGPNRGEYTILNPPNTFVDINTDTVVTLNDGALFEPGSEEPYAPPTHEQFTGKFEAQAKPLTAVEYLGAPILNNTHTAELASLPTVLFALLEGLLPAGALLSIIAGIATLCVVLFFVTSSDSASMVIDIIASGGNPDPPVGTRLFWAITEGFVAAGILLAGGITALQSASLTAALPFLIVLLLACVALVKALHAEPRHPSG